MHTCNANAKHMTQLCKLLDLFSTVVFVMCSHVLRFGHQALLVLSSRGIPPPAGSGRMCMLGWSASLSSG